MENLKRFEENIEDYMNKLKIIKTKDADELIVAILTIFEHSNNLRNIQGKFELEFDEESHAVNTALKKVLENGITQKDTDICKDDIEILMKKAKQYNIIETCFMLYKNNQMRVVTNRNKVQFIYKSEKMSINYDIEVLNIYNKEMKCKKIVDNLSSKLQYTTIRTFEDLLKFSESSINETLYYGELLDEIEMGENKIRDIFEVIKVLTACSLEVFLSRRQYCVIRIDVDILINKISKRTSLEFEKVKTILNLITYDGKYDIMITPLVKINIEKKEEYLLSTSLFINNNFERNIMVLFKNKDNKEYSKLNRMKEQKMIDNIVANIGKYDNLVVCINKELKGDDKKKITDIDIAIYDKKAKTIFVLEAKNFITPDGIKEHNNFIGRDDNDGIRKAFNQVELVKSYYYNKKEAFLQLCFPEEHLKGEDIVQFGFCVISKEYLGNYTKDDIEIINEMMFYELLEKYKGNIPNIIDEIVNKNYYPDSTNYCLKTKRMKFVKYNIKWDEYELKLVRSN